MTEDDVRFTTVPTGDLAWLLMETHLAYQILEGAVVHFKRIKKYQIFRKRWKNEFSQEELKREEDLHDKYINRVFAYHYAIERGDLNEPVQKK
jgi:hypothetical protein